MRFRAVFLRDFEANGHFETFVVSAVSAVLVVRLALHLAGYPRLGGRVLHVAHMVWGGLFMLAAFVVLLSFLGRSSDRLAAGLGGFGFGLFIDEVGKYLTLDNDYFYRPAVAVMYVTFVAVFLAVHAIHSRRAYTPTEYLLNALRTMEEAALRDMDPAEKARALEYLERCDPTHPLVAALRGALERVRTVPPPVPSPFARTRERARAAYARFVRLPGFDRALIVFFIGQLAAKLGYAGMLVAERGRELTGLQVAQLAASGVAATFVAAGIVRLRTSRRAAYLAFERAILVSILLVQPFSFYSRQFAALVELAFNLSVLAALRAMVRLEQERAVGQRLANSTRG